MPLREEASRAGGTRCVAHTRAWRDGVLVDQGFDVARVSDHLADASEFVWLDLLQPDEQDMSVLVEELGLHPLAVEDVLHRQQRPKLERYADHLFLTAYAVRLDGSVGLGPVLVGTIVSFVVAYASIAWLLRFVATHSIVAFVPYRIALGIAVLGVIALT